MTMIMFNDYDDDDDNYHCYNGNVLSIKFFLHHFGRFVKAKH